MDKISKRSKGYAFIEYTTEEAANAALKEMNGKVGSKMGPCMIVTSNLMLQDRERLTPTFPCWCFQIINGWMIVVDVAKPTPQKYSRSRQKLAG